MNLVSKLSTYNSLLSHVGVGLKCGHSVRVLIARVHLSCWQDRRCSTAEIPLYLISMKGLIRMMTLKGKKGKMNVG